MPAMLPWPKMPKQPAKNGCSLAVALDVLVVQEGDRAPGPSSAAGYSRFLHRCPLPLHQRTGCLTSSRVTVRPSFRERVAAMPISREASPSFPPTAGGVLLRMLLTKCPI